MPEPSPSFNQGISRPILRYIANTILQVSVRKLARIDDISPSTVSRQVARVEDERDNPERDHILGIWCAYISAHEHEFTDKGNLKELESMLKSIDSVSETQLKKEAKRILKRLLERDVFILFDHQLETAALIRDIDTNRPSRLAVFERNMAEAFLMRDWIERVSKSGIGKYSITGSGRAALKRLYAEEDEKFRAQHQEIIERDIEEDKTRRRYRVNANESPLWKLSRQKDKDGHPYLTHRQVLAGERLREDFELSHIGPRITQNWDKFLYQAARGQFNAGSGEISGSEAARKQLNDALAFLGTGLADIAFRSCCYLEGLETVEKKLGWSARSGKVVLRIALDRLAEFYEIPHYDRRY